MATANSKTFVEIDKIMQNESPPAAHLAAAQSPETAVPKKRRSSVTRTHPPTAEMVLRAAARIQQYDFTTEAGCRQYLANLVEALGKFSLNGDIYCTDPAAQELLLSLGVLGTVSKE